MAVIGDQGIENDEGKAAAVASFVSFAVYSCPSNEETMLAGGLPPAVHWQE